jgi:hypothetical protein
MGGREEGKGERSHNYSLTFPCAVFTPFASVVLENIPLSVILGVFFYLAYASIGGVQLFTRIKLLVILPKYHPDVIYVRKVR